MAECKPSCPCQGTGGVKGPCLTVPNRERAPRFVARSPLAFLPPADARVWGAAAAGSVAVARRGAKWTADDRARAKRELKAAGVSWGDAYRWAVARGVEGLYPSSLNPQVAFEYLADREKVSRG